jgi:hypothetical protein
MRWEMYVLCVNEDRLYETIRLCIARGRDFRVDCIADDEPEPEQEPEQEPEPEPPPVDITPRARSRRRRSRWDP